MERFLQFLLAIAAVKSAIRAHLESPLYIVGDYCPNDYDHVEVLQNCHNRIVAALNNSTELDTWEREIIGEHLDYNDMIMLAAIGERKKKVAVAHLN